MSVHKPRFPSSKFKIPGWVLSIVGVATVFFIWQLIYSAHFWSEVFVPSPASVAAKFLETTSLHDGVVGYEGFTLWQHLAITLQRIVLSSVTAIGIGVPLGFVIGLVPAIRHLLWPLVTFVRQLPPLAYLSLLVIWLGIDEAPKLVLLIVAAVPPITVATAEGIAGISRDYLNAAKSLGAGKLALIATVLLPASLPEIFTGVRLGVGVAYTSVVAAETINGLPGLGGMIRDAQRYNLTSVVILGILVLGATGLMIDFLLARAQQKLTPWRGRV